MSGALAGVLRRPTLLAALALAVVTVARHASLLAPRTPFDLLADNAVLGIAAVGMTFVIVAGAIDLSVGSVSALASVCAALWIGRAGLPAPLAFALVVAGGVAFGALQGVLVQRLGLAPFLVTLAGMFLARGIALALTREPVPITAADHGLLARAGVAFGPGLRLGPDALAWLALTLAAAWVLARTRFGRAVHALGGNAEAARLFGLPVARTRIGVFAISGGCAALSGAVATLYSLAGSPTAAAGLELDAIAAVVVGGASLSGGTGGAFGTLAGVCIFGWIQMMIFFEGTLGAGWTRVAAGGLLLAFVALQRFAGRAE